MSFDQAKATVETLERAWTVRTDNTVPWQPFQNSDWSITGNSNGPIEEIRRAREAQGNDDNQIDLREACHRILDSIWNGDGLNTAIKDTTSPVSRSYPGNNHQFHCYRFDKPNHSRWTTWRNHPDFSPQHPDVWWCKSVRDAAAKYSWSDSGVGSFENLALALQNAVHKNDSLLAAAVCLKILTWGGVRSRGTKAPTAFENWIFQQAASGVLCKTLIAATVRLIPQNTGDTDIFDGRSLFMDSSSTKIYAALSLDISQGVDRPRQDVLIYDGRVAAALGLITRYTLASVGINTLPENLKFPVERRASRNPSCNSYRFPPFNYGNNGEPTHQARAKYAKVAARYIQAFTGIHAPSSEFFVAEQGLFMIGYAVNQCCEKTAKHSGQ